MSRTNNEDNSAFNQHFASGKFSHSHKVLTGDVVLTQNGSLVNFLDPNGTNRTCTLPVLDKGRFYVVSHVGTTNTITVNSSTAVLVTSLVAGDTALMFASDDEWIALRGWAALAVFTNTVNGLVPAPNSATPGSLFLRDDGQWGQVQVTGIVDAFKFVTDGTNTAIGAGPDTLRVRSSDGSITAVVTDSEAVFGDNVNFAVVEANVDHDVLQNYVADQHIAHSSVTLTAGEGLSGGGTLAANRTFTLDLSELTLAVPVLTDFVPEYDAVDGQFRSTWTQVNAVFVHNNLVGYVANEHINHAGVSVVAGSGIAGGGTIETSRTISLDINGLTADTIATGDFLSFYDISGADNNKVTFANFNATLDHAALVGYVADQHVAHSGVTLAAGSGLTGGGTIAASRTFEVGAGVGITVNADDVSLDTTHARNVDHSAVSISTSEGVQGGGTIAGTRALKLDINGLTADVAPDSAADYVATYDASTGVHKKVLLSNLPAGSGLDINGLSALTALDTADSLPVYDLSATANRKVTVSEFYKAISTLTAKTTLNSADEFVLYDSAGAAAKKINYTNLIAAEAATLAATQANQEAATSNVLFVTPGRQHFHPSALKHWIRFNTTTILASYNCLSITKNSTGNMTVSLNTAISSVNYGITCNAGESGGGHYVIGFAAGTYNYITRLTTDHSTHFDSSNMSAMVAGDH